jgi:hypothetical protein
MKTRSVHSWMASDSDRNMTVLGSILWLCFKNQRRFSSIILFLGIHLKINQNEGEKDNSWHCSFKYYLRRKKPGNALNEQ